MARWPAVFGRASPNENDWALVHELKLSDGRTVRGKYSAADRRLFLPLAGEPEIIDHKNIVAQTRLRYVSFPPFPAVLMLPGVALAGLKFNDVLFTALWAALNPALLFALLQSLAAQGLSRRTRADNLWLTAAFGLGSVYFFSSVLGQVWFTAHVVGVTLVILYAWGSLQARHPYLAGLTLGLGFATRTPLGFMFPLFLWESVRATGGWRSLGQQLKRFRLPAGLWSKCWRFALPAALVLLILLYLNYLRFGKPTEFGHTYLNIVWRQRIEQWGLFNYHFLSRNLAAALVLMPRILNHYPFVQISQHGLSLLITSPYLLYLFSCKRSFVAPKTLVTGLWLTVLAAALPSLIYQNSGFIQFGYRFSLDYMILLMILLALGQVPLQRSVKILIVCAVVVNLFGAITFGRLQEFYFSDSFFPHGASAG